MYEKSDIAFNLFDEQFLIDTFLENFWRKLDEQKIFHSAGKTENLYPLSKLKFDNVFCDLYFFAV